MSVSATQESQVRQNRKKQPQEIDSLGGHIAVDHERVYKRGQGQEDKAQNQN